MILDNQNLPEIVVSREMVQNNNLAAAGVVSSSGERYEQSSQEPRETKKIQGAVNIPQSQASPKRHREQVNHNDPKLGNLGGRPLAGWDDAPGSPQRVPAVSNNNGSPRLTNRIANIYGINRHHQVHRQQNVVDSPHGSPIHQAIARIASPKRGWPRKPPDIQMEEGTDVSESSDKMTTFKKMPSTRNDSDSPKKSFLNCHSPSPNSGYHNPYLMPSNSDKSIKSPLLCTTDYKFKYDSPKHKMKLSTDSPKRTFKSPVSPCNLLDNDRRFSADSTFSFNVNDSPQPSSTSPFPLLKSRIPTKISFSNPKHVDVKNDNYSFLSTQNNLSATKPQRAISPRIFTKSPINFETGKISTTNSASAEDSASETNSNRFNGPISGSPKRSNICSPYSANVFKFEKITHSVEDNVFDSKTSENSDIVDHRTSVGSDVWNSGGCDPTTASWNSNTGDLSLDEQSKMSIEDRYSLKKTSVDSLKPRTNSLGSWPQSGSISLEKSCADSSTNSMRGSLGGIENISDTDSGMAESVSSKMVLIKCKDGNYLTRVFVNNQGQCIVL